MSGNQVKVFVVKLGSRRVWHAAALGGGALHHSIPVVMGTCIRRGCQLIRWIRNVQIFPEEV